MTTEVSTWEKPIPSEQEFARSYLLESLVRMQNKNDWSNDVVLPSLYQKLYAERLCEHLRQHSYLQRFGGRVIEIVLTPTDEPYMYKIGVSATLETK